MKASGLLSRKESSLRFHTWIDPTCRIECLIHTSTRWKACRLGAGALFGDRPAPESTAACSPVAKNQTWGTQSETAPAPEWSSGPALETAITAEETEVLEIGVASYRRCLAKGARERTCRAVAVLKATGALVRTVTQLKAFERRLGPVGVLWGVRALLIERRSPHLIYMCRDTGLTACRNMKRFGTPGNTPSQSAPPYPILYLFHPYARAAFDRQSASLIP